MSRLPVTFTAFAISALALIATAGPAFAHAEPEATLAANGATAITLTVSHGCDGAATNDLRVQLPTGAANVTAQNPAGWTSTIDATEVHWSGTPLSATDHHKFSFTLALSQPSGTTVSFPTLQGCQGGEQIAWIEQTQAGQPEPAHPAPKIVVPAGAISVASSTAITATNGPTTTARMAINSAAITNEGSPQSTAGRIVFFGVLGVIGGGALVLFLKYRKRVPQA